MSCKDRRTHGEQTVLQPSYCVAILLTSKCKIHTYIHTHTHRLSKYSPSGTSYTYQRPKEKPLRIYTEEDEVDKQNDDD